MTLYRATDAADTMNLAALLIAAYCQCTGMALTTLASYLQVRQEHSRAAGPREAEPNEVAGMLGAPLPPADGETAQTWSSWGSGYAGASRAVR
ncbi:hypothetical protein ACF05R_28560 [Streptomyces albidoflavus]